VPIDRGALKKVLVSLMSACCGLDDDGTPDREQQLRVEWDQNVDQDGTYII
jgi:hypothetical protein